MPFFKSKDFTFTPADGRDFYLDIYVNAVTKDLLQTQPEKGHFSSITKE